MFFDFKIFIYTIKKIMKKDKKKITITIDKKVLEGIEKLTTNKSRLIEYVLLNYIGKFGIKTDDIIL
jgi:hypothetical protein